MANIEELLYTTAHDLNIPLNVQIELLNKCNMQCKHCYIPNHNCNGFSTDKVISLLLELKKMGTLNLTLTGGEIFLRDDILKIIKYARKLHFRVTLLTNASLLNEDIIKELSDLHLALVSVSLYSLNETIFNSITRTKNQLEKVKENLELLSKYKIRSRINCPIMKENKDFSSVLDYSKSKGFLFKGSTIIFPQTDGNTLNCGLKLSDYDMIEVNKKIFKTTEDNKFSQLNPIELYPLEMCPSLSLSLSIDCIGNVYPCNSLNIKVGNVYDMSLTQIINSKKLQNIRKLNTNLLKKCITCKIKEYCSRCPAIIYSETNNLIGCSKTVFNIAQANYLYKKGEK